jgi:hypothetical protein
MGMGLIYHKKDDASGMSSLGNWHYEYHEKKRHHYSKGDNRESKLEKAPSSYDDNGDDNPNSIVPGWNIYQMRSSGKGYYGRSSDKGNDDAVAKGSDSSSGKGLDSKGTGGNMPDPLCHPKSEKLLKSMGKGKGGASKGGKAAPIGPTGKNAQKKSPSSSTSKGTKSIKMSKVSSKQQSLSSSGNETKDMHSPFKGGGDDSSPSKKTSDDDYRHKPSWDEHSTKKLTKKKSKYSDMTTKSSKSKLKSISSYNDEDGQGLEHHQYQTSFRYVI